MNDYTGHQQRVGHIERERAERFLQEAFAEGRLDDSEFEERIDRALNARTRADLNASVANLVPVTSRYVGAHPVYRPPAAKGSPDVPGAKGVAGVAHLLPFISWIIGPAFVYALSAEGSYARREAAKSFNWTLLSSLVFGGLVFLSVMLGFGVAITGFAFVGWSAVNIVAAVQAFAGNNWRNPIMRVLPLKPLSED